MDYSNKDSERVQKLLDKKSELNSKINDTRDSRYTVLKKLDAIWINKVSFTGESQYDLINELYNLNLELNRLRDKVDKINKKLYNSSYI